MNCDNVKLITDYSSSIEDLSSTECSEYLDVCCHTKDVRITPKKCGLSNPNGIGIKITSNDHETEFGNI